MTHLKPQPMILLEIVDACNALRLFASTQKEFHLQAAKERLFALYRKQLEAGGVTTKVSHDEFWDVDFMRRRRIGERRKPVADESNHQLLHITQQLATARR